ncbi:NAD(P)-binding protein [Lizonia empirigonia]|nr:NAD(P)-binding protein [Lizonia empirigonia]
MVHILITGSSGGLGSIVAQKLISRGHSVETVVTGDLSDMASTKAMAKQIKDLGSFDCIIHNAGLYQGGFRKTSDGIPALAAVNTLAPYILTALVNKPKRLIFLSSEMHQSGSADLSDPLWTKGETGFSDTAAYCASKLHNILFAKAFAKRWPDVQSNALDPGWRRGCGSGDSAKKSGQYFRPGKKLGSPQKATEDEKLQDRLLEACGEFSGVKL